MVSPAPTVAESGPQSLAVVPQVKGTIKNTSNVALAGMAVCLVNPVTQNCEVYTTTAANGTYALDATAGSWYVMTGEATYPYTNYLPGYWSATGFQYYTADAGVVVVTTTDVTGKNINVPPIPRIRGTVTNATGDPVSGKTITSTFAISEALTDANGDYALKVWPGQDQKVGSYWDQTYRSAWYSTNGTVEFQDDATMVSVGFADVIGIDLDLTTWPKVSGHVTDANGDPVSSVVVTFYGSYQHTTSTDATGAYSGYLYGGGGSAWTVYFERTGWIPQSSLVSGSTDMVRDIVLHHFPTVSGQVVDPHGAPAPGVTVSVGAYPNSVTDTTDINGMFAIEWTYYYIDTPVTIGFADPSGTYVPGFLSEDGFTRWDYGIAATTFVLDPDEEFDASATIPAYVHVSGHVLFEDGTAAAGSYVTPVSGHGYGSWVAAGVDGSFSLTVAPDAYSLTVPGGYYGAEGFAYRSGAVEPIQVGNADMEIEVILPAGHVLSGRVTAGGIPRNGVEVDIYLGSGPAASVTTDEDGNWSTILPPGAYTVGLYDPSLAYAHGWIGPTGFTADPDVAKVFGLGLVDSSTGTVALPSTRKVSGKVVSSVYGSGVSYAYVEAFVDGVFYSSQYASSSGAFSLSVAPGKVTLWMFDAYTFNNAPGWRTATSLSANFANAAAITVSSSSVSGIVIKTPESVYLNWNAIYDGSIEAIYNGAATSFAVDDGSGHSLMPLLKGSYRFWVDANLSESPYNSMPDGWYKAPTLTADVALATVRSVTTSANLTVNIPTSGVITGATRDAFNSSIPNVDVLLYANGHFYADVVSNGGFNLHVVPGTYRLAFVDLYGEYQTGWLGDDGFVSDFAGARDVTVTAGGYVENLNVELPMGAPPGPPTNLVATPYHQSVGVSFTPPTTTLVRPIIHYAVTANPGGRQCIATVTPSCTVTGLTNGTSYTFTATASTIVGSSATSAPSAAAVPLPVPGAPTAVVATPTTSTIDLTWAAATDNGSAITGYTATLSPGGQSCQTASGDPLACSISGVPDGKYVASVRAANGHGNGPAGTASAIVDTTGPTVTAPVTVLRSGLSMSGTSVPVSVSWTNVDALTGIADTSLQLQAGAGSFVDQTLAAPTSVSLLRNLSASSSAYRFRALAADGNGNLSSWATGPATYIGLKQQSGTGTGTAYSGSWSTSTTSTALGGSLRTTTAKGAYVTFTYTGRGFALVSRKTSTSGQAKIYVDGAYVATIDLRSSTTVSRWIAYARTSTTSAKHVVKIVNVATSGRPRIWIDAFLTIR